MVLFFIDVNNNNLVKYLNVKENNFLEILKKNSKLHLVKIAIFNINKPYYVQEYFLLLIMENMN